MTVDELRKLLASQPANAPVLGIDSEGNAWEFQFADAKTTTDGRDVVVLWYRS